MSQIWLEFANCKRKSVKYRKVRKNLSKDYHWILLTLPIPNKVISNNQSESLLDRYLRATSPHFFFPNKYLTSEEYRRLLWKLRKTKAPPYLQAWQPWHLNPLWKSDVSNVIYLFGRKNSCKNIDWLTEDARHSIARIVEEDLCVETV